MSGEPWSELEIIGNQKLQDKENARFMSQPKYGPQKEDIPSPQSVPVDAVTKPYGKIVTLVSNGNYACKRIYMKAGGQSSMEYHIDKVETYIVEEGILEVCFRVGRAENYSLLVYPKESITIPRGMAHMRIAKTDIVILEVSTPDNNADSHLIEDGNTYTFVGERLTRGEIK